MSGNDAHQSCPHSHRLEPGHMVDPKGKAGWEIWAGGESKKKWEMVW